MLSTASTFLAWYFFLVLISSRGKRQRLQPFSDSIESVEVSKWCEVIWSHLKSFEIILKSLEVILKSLEVILKSLEVNLNQSKLFKTELELIRKNWSGAAEPVELIGPAGFYRSKEISRLICTSPQGLVKNEFYNFIPSKICSGQA
jgi:hypothetical protein